MTNEEAKMAALNDLRETMGYMVKLRKELVWDTKKGVHLQSYRDFQDTYLKLKQMISVVNRKLQDWKNLLSEDEDGNTIYSDIGEDGFEFTPVKTK